MSRHWILADFADAQARLAEALAQPATSDLVRAGCIQYFEFCFELAWKAVKAVAEEHGLEPCQSPKACFKTAFTLGWIAEEGVWLEMLEARNRMSHTYDARRALRVYERLADFLPALAGLLGRLRQA
jgi:nucleotidyltransferase substrate binding protein (TIGR01987 family)